MSDRAHRTWIITQEPGMVPKRKGPFHAPKRVEDFLREAYKLNPEIVCIVIDMENDDNTWWPEHGHAWLDINGDRRRRHPRKDKPPADNPSPITHVVGGTPAGYRRTEPRDGFAEDGLVPISQYGEATNEEVSTFITKAADAYVAEQGIEHSGGIVERAFEAGVRWSTLRSLPEGFTRKEIEDMLSIVQDEPQTIDGGGEFGPQESTDGWYTRLLRTILKNAEGAR